MKLKILFILLTFIFMPTFAAAQEVGKQAPDFTLVDYEGNTHSLSGYKGKFVVLEWINPQCPYVVKHYKSENMQELQKKYTDQDVIWLTINSSAEGKQGHLTAAMAKQEKAEQNAHMTAILLDHDGKVGKLYGAKTTPHMYVINPEGELIYAGAIDDNSSSRPADAKTAKNYVVQALEHAKQGNPVEVAFTAPYGCSVKYAS